MVRKTEISQEKINKIIDLYTKEYQSVKKIKKQIGIGHCIIARILRENNISPNKFKDYRKLNNWSWKRVYLDRDKIKKLYLEDRKSMVEIGKIFGHSFQPINRVLKEEGVRIRETGEHSKGKKNIKSSETRKRLFSEGKIKVWNKGLTKEDPRVLKNTNRGSRKTQFKKGNISPFKDKTQENYEPLMNASKKMSETKKRLFKEGKITPWNKGKPFLAGKKNPNYGIVSSKEKRKKISDSNKKRWKDEDFKQEQLKKQRAGMSIRPTSPERVLKEIIEKNNLPFNYVGDGAIWFKGFNPDFLSKNPKHIIEVDGDYWHNLPKSIEKDKRKIEAYASLGYRTLILWEHELTGNHGIRLSEQEIVNKIQNFLKT